MTTWPPMNVERKLSLRTRMRVDFSRATTLVIVALLHVFAHVRRHVAGTAPRTIIVAFRRPYVRPLAGTFCAAGVISEIHGRAPQMRPGRPRAGTNVVAPQA